MRILIVTPYYLPDGGPSAALFALLAEALARRGQMVSVLCAAPHYPSGRVAAAYRGWRVRRSEEHGVEVIRLPMFSAARGKMALRMAQFAWYQVSAAAAGLGLDYDVMLAVNPALNTGLPFWALSTLRGKPAVFSVHDVYPDVGVKLGVFRSAWVVDMVAAMERYCVEQARYVRILSESFRAPLRRLGATEEKLRLIYDWVDTTLITPLPRVNAFAQEHGLERAFVVQYAGNIGLSQGLEHVLEAARRLKDDKDILFLFVGDGAGKERLVEEARADGLENVLFLPYQPRERLSEMLASANLCLIPLQRGVGANSLPSKSFSILSSGRPILAAVEAESDLARLVGAAQAGEVAPPEDGEALAAAILRMKLDPEKLAAYGESGRRYVLAHHSPEAAALAFEQLFEAAVR